MNATTTLANPLLRIGWLVNPVAGIGGAVANKGSDDRVIQERAYRGEIPLRAPQRAALFLSGLLAQIPPAKLPPFVTVAGAMGAQSLIEQGIPCDVISYQTPQYTSASDTREALVELMASGIDLLIFVGGDGTARDVCAVVAQALPVLGVPAGVKMHSGVFGVTPQAAATVVARLLCGELTALHAEEVRDIDEQLLREGKVNSRHFGNMLVPVENQYMQHVKQGGVEVEELVLLDITAEIRERLEDCEHFPVCLVFAPGSTTDFIQQELGFEHTLLGVDVVIVDSALTAIATFCDVTAEQLENRLSAYENRKLILTAIGGQGHIVGRGNQQLSARVLSAIGKSNTWVVATKTKLEALQQRPLLFDSSDPALDRIWQGFIPVICGYRDQLLYPLGLAPHDDKLPAPIMAALLEKKATFLQSESRRIFHGRGGSFKELEWCCIDYFAPVLLVTLFQSPPSDFLAQLSRALRELFTDWSLDPPVLLVQHRYQRPLRYELLAGEMPETWLAQWRGLDFELSSKHQNIGFFLDAEPVRAWLLQHAANTRVLNLFAYTCAFSVVACKAGATTVVNIDMSRASLETGRRNHLRNELNHVQVKYLPHNIFKSWGKLKQLGPYDIVIIDPPSFQKGSFVAAKDYSKVLRRLNDLVAEGGCFIACHNAPETTHGEFRQLIETQCDNFELEQHLAPSDDFPDAEPDRALKMLVFRRRAQL